VEKNGVSLNIATGLATIRWTDGKTLETFVHADAQEGWFRCHGFGSPEEIMRLLAPQYGAPKEADNANSVQGSDLARLGYTQGVPVLKKGIWTYRQAGWGEFNYEIAVAVKQLTNGDFEGVWSISSQLPGQKSRLKAEKLVKKAIERGFEASLQASAVWWEAYWAKSSVSIPDELIEREYYLDMYKFGCTAREDGPMISLQAVWTADNGRLPPWKGDLHHDLNTQMSYWPAYTSNHLSEGLSYLNHLERNDRAHRAYTRKYFGTSGLNIPGVTTFDGTEMGGWIQYSCSPTVAAWCAQHFYQHWRYSRDREWLKEHAWPFMRDVAIHLSEVTSKNTNGIRVLPLSSSPEINDNSISAWFQDTWTNYDLSLTRFVFEKTAELAGELGLSDESEHWLRLGSELPGFSTEPDGALKFAPQLNYRTSHRHFSHLMAIHPLGLLDWGNEADRPIIRRSLALLDSVGPSQWCGYSWAWLASLRARAHDGEGAREALRIFASSFVSANSFHLNGDQSGKGYSSFTYDPFTLEGNFACASGLQEMLLQSQNGIVRVFPAIPDDWRQEVSFRNLRAEGAFLISAESGKNIKIIAEQGGLLVLAVPPGDWYALGKHSNIGVKEGIWKCNLEKGERVMLVTKG
jgi:alpha-L-fucosidase 2